MIRSGNLYKRHCFLYVFSNCFIFQEDFNASLNRIISADDFVSTSYERLLDEKIEEIKREAAKLEATYWGSKKNDFAIKK